MRSIIVSDGKIALGDQSLQSKLRNCRTLYPGYHHVEPGAECDRWLPQASLIILWGPALDETLLQVAKEADNHNKSVLWIATDGKTNNKYVTLSRKAFLDDIDQSVSKVI
jgi:hypothetical protein